MSRVSRIVTAVNWRYAVGEVVLIVVGILIALTVADWNERRIERNQELAMPGELRTALEQDLVAIEDALDEVLKAEQQLQSLQQLLAHPRPYDPTMDELFGAVYGTRIIFLNTASHESLRFSGLQTISNDKLRLSIAHLLSEFCELMVLNNEIDLEINLDLMRPYYLQNFRDLQIKKSATPIDYAAVINDPYYRNIVDYQLFVLRSNRISNYSEIIDKISDVVALLDDELS